MYIQYVLRYFTQSLPINFTVNFTFHKVVPAVHTSFTVSVRRLPDPI